MVRVLGGAPAGPLPARWAARLPGVAAALAFTRTAGGREMGFGDPAAPAAAWGGELEGSPGPGSLAVLQRFRSGALHGKIRFYDRGQGRVRAFRVSAGGFRV